MLASRIAAIQSRIRRWLKPPRQLQFTRLGTYIVLLTLGIGFAAMNTGNNLVYMVFGMMLGVITASGIISEMSLRGLSIDWILPGEMSAKQSASLRVILKNNKRAIPSIGLLVQFADPFAPASNTSVKNSAQTLLKAFFLFVPAGGQRSGDISLRPDRRGEYKLPLIKVETQFPFGFFKKSLTVEPETSLLVYPAHVPIRQRLQQESAKRREHSTPVRGAGENFWGLRDFAQGDNPRRILWKPSAKRNRWMVLETERDRDRELLADLRPIEDWRGLSPADLEEAVAFTATYLIKCFEKGLSVGLVSEDFYIAPSGQRKDLAEMLRYLALFDPRGRQQLSAESSSPVHSPASPNGVAALPLWKTQRVA